MLASGDLRECFELGVDRRKRVDADEATGLVPDPDFEIHGRNVIESVRSDDGVLERDP